MFDFYNILNNEIYFSAKIGGFLMDILWACGYEVYDDILNELLSSLEKKGLKPNVVTKYNKKSFLNEIEMANNYNIVVLREGLEADSFDIDILERIAQFNLNGVFLYILNDGHKGSMYAKELVNTGIYNVLFYGDVSSKTVLDLINNPRNRPEAKVYLKYDDVQINVDDQGASFSKPLKSNMNYSSDISNIVPRIIEKEIITEKIKGTLFLTFAGADYNIGCTHAACSTAYYLSRQGYKTAYLEMCDDPVFFKGYKDDSTVKEIEGGYTVEKNLDLYVKYLNGNVEYGKAVSNGYQYIVVDVGCIFKRNKKGVLETNENIKEMERATISVLVGAGSKWQLSNIVEAAKLGHDNWKLYINFTDNDIEKAIIKTISKMTNKEAYLAPYTPNCFKKYSEQDEFLEILLKDILPAKIIKKPGIVNRIFSKKIRR